MALSAGIRLGPYEIVSAIGAGGMGEVYRARDTKLGRDVALKVLPEIFAQDPERLARFKREAQVLASLNHTHIAQIYGIEDAPSSHSAGPGHITALVMELVDGETLAEALTHGSGLTAQGTPELQALPLADSLAIAHQIALALAAAHEHGIIHRDLKPSNIKVTSEGVVKVLDFGLAKPSGPEATASGSGVMVTNSPTLTSPASTALGMILGTAAYMAPEQAKGHVVDKRADVWAFGCVLYEMLAGRRAFEGEDVSETLASVLRSDPDWHALPADLAPAIRRLLERCLAKDRRRRVGDISTALFVLDEATALTPPAIAAPPARRARWPLIAATAASLVIGAALATAGGAVFRTPATAETRRLSIVLPADRPVAFGWSPGLSLAISPDGTEIAYVSLNSSAPPEQRTQLRVRSLASIAVHDLPGTFMARQPFFSPDGKWVAFFTTAGELKKVAVAGGNPVPIADKINASQWARGLYLDAKTIVFGADGPMFTVSADGGPPAPLTKLDAAQGEVSHAPLSFMPEAGAVLFRPGFRQLRDPRIDAVVLQSGSRRVLVENASSGQFVASGHLVFTRNDTLLVAPLDPVKMALGSAVPLVDEIRHDGDGTGNVLQAAVSGTGTLAYVPAADESARVLGRVSRDGTFEPIGAPAGVRPRISPDGQHVAIEVVGPQETIVYSYDLARRTTTKLTQSGSEAHITWRPDGKALVVSAVRPEGRGIYLKELNGAERLLLAGDPSSVEVLRPESFSPDGTVLAFTRQKGTQHDIWLLTLSGTDKVSARAFINSSAAEHSPKFSPDGHWLAYVSDQSNRPEVYVRGYPQGEPIPVSADGGGAPVWSPDGRTLFYSSTQAGSGVLMGVPVTPERGSLALGTAAVVLKLRTTGGSYLAGSGNRGPAYDVLRDGRFLMMRGPDQQGEREIVLVEHWFEELRRLAATNP